MCGFGAFKESNERKRIREKRNHCNLTFVILYFPLDPHRLLHHLGDENNCSFSFTLDFFLQKIIF